MVLTLSAELLVTKLEVLGQDKEIQRTELSLISKLDRDSANHSTKFFLNVINAVELTIKTEVQ